MEKNKMTLTFLGTGTSTGVPQINCDCHTCTSPDPRDKRMRASAVLETPEANILIDCGPDFWRQILSYFNFRKIDAVLLTHTHYDHVGGVDDLRPYSTPEGLPIYCRWDVERDLRARIPYCFKEHPYPGVPHFCFREVKAFHPFCIGGLEIMPLDIIHSPLIENILGYRFGENFAYITDALTIPEESLEKLTGLKVLVMNALRHEPHASHQNLEQALKIIERLRPEKTYLIHMSHDMGRHAETSVMLPENVEFAFDGLKIDIPVN